MLNLIFSERTFTVKQFQPVGFLKYSDDIILTLEKHYSWMIMEKTDYSRKWWVMASVAMGVFLATIDGSIVNIALPNLVADFNMPLAVVEWVVLAYLLTVTTLMLSVGRLADMIGKKKIYLAGIILFTIGSALCGTATNVYALIGYRVFQAVGAAMTQALGTAIVTEAFPDAERGKALGIIGSIVSIGVIAGPTIGGLILSSLTWHWLFFVNLPVGIIGTFMVLKFVPADHKGTRQRFDTLGAGTLFISMISLLLALSIGQTSSFASLRVILLFVMAAVVFIAFVNIERKITEPMIDPVLFSNKRFSTNLVTGFITFVGTAGSVLLMPFYLLNMRGFSPEKAGLMLIVVPLVSGLLAPIAGSLSDRGYSRVIASLGLASQVIGFFLISTLDAQTTLIGYILRYIPVGIGIGFFQAPNNSMVMGSAPKNRLGIASGLLSLTRTLGQTTGIAILSAVWSGRVASYISVMPEGGATSAPVAAQISGLQDSFQVIAGIVIVALLVSLWSLIQSQREKLTERPYPANPRSENE